MVSQKSRYALKALLMLADAERHAGGPLLISEMAKKGKMPRKFLEAILLELKNQGLLKSKKGKGGGYHLAKDPNAIPIGAVIRALEGDLSQALGIASLDEDEESMSGIRALFAEVEQAASKILDQATLGTALRVQDEIQLLRQHMYYI